VKTPFRWGSAKRWIITREDLEAFLLATRGPVATDLDALRLKARRGSERAGRRQHREARRVLERMGVL